MLPYIIMDFPILNEADHHRFKREVGRKQKAYSGAQALHSSDP